MTLSCDDCDDPKYSPIIHIVDFLVPEVTSGQHICMMHGFEESPALTGIMNRRCDKTSRLEFQLREDGGLLQ